MSAARGWAAPLLVAVVLAGCDRGAPPAAAGAPAAATQGPAPATAPTAAAAVPTGAPAAPVAPAAPLAPAAAAPAVAPPPLPSPGATPAAPAGRFAARTREIVNPDPHTMVFLYLDLAGLKAPVEEWVEKDNRVQFAPPIEKAARRTAVRAELEAGLASVKEVGQLRLSLANAQLSDYDPSNGEFVIGALSPASELVFSALGQKVVTRFSNGETAQLWRVPAAEAQALRDRTRNRNVALDTVLRITDVQPGPGGGALVTRIESYALRAADGSTIARLP